jgi:6-pyruvoyltetrahydropterin/6-carboxytetrahydropterin synthase
MITVTKVFEFEAAHYLPGYEGNCSRMHGHSYKLEVEVHNEKPNDRGMVIDFKELKRIVKMRVVDRLDHQELNRLSDKFGYQMDCFTMPTAENLVAFVHVELHDAFSAIGIKLVRIRLWETSTSYAEWKV